MTRHTQRDPDPDTQMTPEDYEAIKPHATVPDVRGCRTHGTTRAEAAANAEEALASMLATLADSAVPFPEPRFTALDDAIYACVAEQSA